jgi:integrase
MKIKCNTKFNIEKRYSDNGLIIHNVPINMVFTYEGKRLCYYTGYRVDAKFWKHDKQCVQGLSSDNDNISDATINSHLKSLAGHINDVYHELKLRKIPATNVLLLRGLKNKLDEPDSTVSMGDTFWDCYDKYLDVIKLTTSQHFVQSATGTKTHLFNFLKGKNISFDEVDYQFFEKFKIYYLTEQKNMMNSFAGAVKRVKIFMNYAYKMGWSNNLKYKEYTVKEEYGTPIYLTWDELKQLYNHKPSTQSLLHIRNLFIFQCNVGCRFEDLMKLTKGDVKDGIISYLSEKSRLPVEWPLPEMALEILQFYRDLSGDKLLPVISNQKYNKYLKILGKEAKLERVIECFDKKKGSIVKKPIHDLITTHMARKIFIGNAINEFDIRTEVIKAVTAHSKNSKAFARYYTIHRETMVKASALIK